MHVGAAIDADRRFRRPGQQRPGTLSRRYLSPVQRGQQQRGGCAFQRRLRDDRAAIAMTQRSPVRRKSRRCLRRHARRRNCSIGGPFVPSRAQSRNRRAIFGCLGRSPKPASLDPRQRIRFARDSLRFHRHPHPERRAPRDGRRRTDQQVAALKLPISNSKGSGGRIRDGDRHLASAPAESSPDLPRDARVEVMPNLARGLTAWCAQFSALTLVAQFPRHSNALHCNSLRLTTTNSPEEYRSVDNGSPPSMPFERYGDEDVPRPVHLKVDTDRGRADR